MRMNASGFMAAGTANSEVGISRRKMDAILVVLG